MFRSTRFKYLLTVATGSRAQQCAKLVAGLCALMMIGPLIHSTAISTGDLPKRIMGMQLTFETTVTAAITNLVPIFLGLIW